MYTKAPYPSLSYSPCTRGISDNSRVACVCVCVCEREHIPKVLTRSQWHPELVKFQSGPWRICDDFDSELKRHVNEFVRNMWVPWHEADPEHSQQFANFSHMLWFLHVRCSLNLPHHNWRIHHYSVRMHCVLYWLPEDKHRETVGLREKFCQLFKLYRGK